MTQNLSEWRRTSEFIESNFSCAWHFHIIDDRPRFGHPWHTVCKHMWENKKKLKKIHHKIMRQQKYHTWNKMNQIWHTWKSLTWGVFFFAVQGLYIFILPTRCLRRAYAVVVFSYAGTICLDLPARAYAYQLFSDFAYAACVWCFCGLSVGLNSSHFAYAAGASVVSWGFVFCTSGYCYTWPAMTAAEPFLSSTIAHLQSHQTLPPTKHFLQHRLRRKTYY